MASLRKACRWRRNRSDDIRVPPRERKQTSSLVIPTEAEGSAVPGSGSGTYRTDDQRRRRNGLAQRFSAGYAAFKNSSAVGTADQTEWTPAEAVGHPYGTRTHFPTYPGHRLRLPHRVMSARVLPRIFTLQSWRIVSFAFWAEIRLRSNFWTTVSAVDLSQEFIAFFCTHAGQT